MKVAIFREASNRGGAATLEALNWATISPPAASSHGLRDVRDQSTKPFEKLTLDLPAVQSPPAASQHTTRPAQRLQSLDQFRGYTIAGMFLVNFVGSFYAAPYLLGHHKVFCSYADTIMPQFLFAVGFSMRLSWSRRTQQDGLASTYLHAIQRSLALAIIAIIWYGGMPHLPEGIRFEWDSFKTIGLWGAIWKQLKVDWFQTLMHIAVTSLWILPVIRASAAVRMLYLVGSVWLHVLLSHWFYFEWNNTSPRGIDGGPLGFLTWTVPTLIGTLAYDWVKDYQTGITPARTTVVRLLGGCVLLCGAGWLLSCGTRWYDLDADRPVDTSLPLPILASDPVIPSAAALARWRDQFSRGAWGRLLAEPPFVPPPQARVAVESTGRQRYADQSSRYRPWNYWMMSQQVGSPSYLIFSAGLCLGILLVCFVVSDLAGYQLSLFRTLGVNALIGYFLHSIVGETVKTVMPRDISSVGLWTGFVVYFLICWLMMRSLEKKRIFFKL